MMMLKPDTLAPEHGAADDRLAVIDVGSNSMRMVVYERLCRSPVALFNEKVLPSLGKTLEKTGRLNPDGVRLALDNLVRFRRLLEGMQVGRVSVLATAAVRDAKDGPAFVAEVEKRTGFTVTILSGEDEARLAAMGVLSGAPQADGIAGDLGGGSLELVRLDRGGINHQVTTPLGPLRLMEVAEGKPGAAQKVIDGHLSRLDWLSQGKGKAFYPVGGAWRAIAKTHLETTSHPLHIIHQYTVDGGVLADYAGGLARMNRPQLEKVPGMSRRRLETLALAALVLERVLRTVQPARVVFSAYGVREGHLYDLLTLEERRQDPLLVSCRQLAARIGRFGHAETLSAWTAPLFAGEDDSARRLREAACLLSDLGWAEHPDYRAELAFLRVLRMPFAGLDHAERAFLAAASFVRYAGTLDSPTLAPAKGLLKDGPLSRAGILGLSLRLAHTLTGGAAMLLQRTFLRLGDEKLTLVLPEDAAMLTGDAVQRRLDALAKALNRTGEITVQTGPRLAG
ncbi:Ppx/GppA family phosphatase [Oleisolibacter albus]|uniref:Ppx/GppA family phosphatase n=1 Tax=Oleisolibacter albus TaxID=2171757 RepID=UPI001EFCFFDB|nr:Ppx/GppA family phosphatase [Oleisolibacter albus]